jgi:hypothetical protein
MIGCEKGTASLEFVLCVPVILAIFIASIESGVLMTRFILLEQSLDITMRNLRLGQYTDPDADLIKEEICKHSIILRDCEATLHIELQPVSTTTWTMPTESVGCVNRDDEAVQPSLTFNPGAAHEIMLIRACVIQDAIFPTTGIGLRLPKDAAGGYYLTASSAFVNEP